MSPTVSQWPLAKWFRKLIFLLLQMLFLMPVSLLECIAHRSFSEKEKLSALSITQSLTMFPECRSDHHELQPQLRKGYMLKRLQLLTRVTENFFFYLAWADIDVIHINKCSYSTMESNLLFDFVHYSTFIVLNIMDHLLKLPVRTKLNRKY